MKRYWDFSEKERAAMTSEHVESLMSAELMEAGVVRVETPAMLPDSPPEIAGETWYTIKSGWSTPNFVFRNAEDAATAMALAVGTDSEYIGGKSYTTATGKREMEIVPVTIYDGAALANNKSIAEQAAANKKANDEALSVYREASKAVSAVVEGVWNDWHKCQATERRYKRIIDTHAEYTAICDGDETKARVFLAKAFPQPDIDEAFEWFGLNIREAMSAA